MCNTLLAGALRGKARCLIAIYGLVLLLAGGCNSLPTIVPDMSPRADAVRLEGKRGPLTTQQSKAVLASLESRSPQTNIFEQHLALEEAVASSPLTVGNKVLLLQDGPTTFQHMFAAIRAAKVRISMETYIFEGDEIGNRFSDALIEKQKQGVKVNLIYDSVGSLDTSVEFFKRLTDNGVNVLQFNPINPLTAKNGWEVNQRDHRKLLVVDGKTAFVGGINISSVYSSSAFGARAKKKRRNESDLPWRDTHVRIEGPVVADLEKMFFATWEKQSGQAPDLGKAAVLENKGNEVVRAIGSSPDDPYSQMYATLISAINSATTSVHLTVAYFVPDPQLVEALKQAVQRGVDVQIILPAKTDSLLVFYAARSHYAELIEGGVKLYERRDALLHAKTAVIDGVWSTIGSTNLDWRSFLHNQEINAVILGPEFGAQMEAMFKMDVAASGLITPEVWKKRSLPERLKEAAARIWAYWL